VLAEPCAHSHHSNEENAHSESKRIKFDREQELNLIGEFFSSHFGKENIEINVEGQTITVNADGESALIELETNVTFIFFVFADFIISR
jgi:hypothetical protein